MQEPITIIKNKMLLPAEDFTAMCQEGIHSIEKLGSDIWTNYNVSDPGITILEAVVYAITDLAYRNGFEVKDLLAPEHLDADTWKNIFYTARQIYHNSALTILDYRKLIIDVPGVRNAWLEASKDYEVPVWIDYNYFETRKDIACNCDGDHEKVCFGKLNLSAADKATTQANNTKRITADQQQITTDLQPKADKLDKAILDLQNQIKIEQDPERKITLTKQLENTQNDRTILADEINEVKQEILMLQNQNFTASKIVEFEGLYNVMVEYEENILEQEARENVRNVVVERLSAHRNICEDFLSINAVEYADFGISASLELEDYADPDAIVAEMFFVIYKYFTPSIPFYTIQQMLDKGYQADEIFDGPALHHGFIENADLEKTDLFRDIRMSDLINEIADIDGIKAIVYFHLPFDVTVKNFGKKYFDEWIDALQAQRKIARVQPNQSMILCCKQREFISYFSNRPSADRRPDRMLKLFKDLKTQEQKYKLYGQEMDLPIPTGEYMELEDYFPVTNSLPACYGVGDPSSLPANADDTKKLKAMQLKGFMLFFEQLLANHLVQLNHLRDIFNFQNNPKHTIFTKALALQNDNHNLLIDHQKLGDSHWKQILDNFSHVLQNITEPPIKYLENRNRMLDHLLGRFSENMDEYSNMSKWLNPYDYQEKLITDKANVLKDGEYYKISSNRGKGYDYTDIQIWDSPNVSGTERRVARLLGFNSADRKMLAVPFLNIEAQFDIDPKTKLPIPKTNKNGDPLNKIILRDPDDKNKIIISSVDVKDGCCSEELMMDILSHADVRSCIKFHDELKQRSRKSAGLVGNFWFEIYDGSNPETSVLLASSDVFDKKEDRDHTYKLLQKTMYAINANEGIHLVEHILLRPKMDSVLDETGNAETVSLLNVCLDNCDLGIGLNEGTDVPTFTKKIHRIPAEKCYDQLPWVLEYFRMDSVAKTISESFLFQQAFADGTTQATPLKFRRYEELTKRVQQINEFGTERVNYELMPNQTEDTSTQKWSFILHGDKKEVLAQSSFIYNKRKINGPEVPDDIEKEIAALIVFFGYQLDLYCQADPCDNNEDPYSFRTTIVIPCWPKRLRDPNFRQLVEQTIVSESPAHTHANVVWVGVSEMQRFENAFGDWLLEMAQTEMPSYEKTNPLMDVINTLKPCGHCDDHCKEDNVTNNN